MCRSTHQLWYHIQTTDHKKSRPPQLTKQRNQRQSYWLLTSITNYIRKTTKSLDIDISEVKQWENAIINEIILRTSKLRSPPQHKFHLTYKIKTIIRELQQHFIFTAVDKSNNDFAIICKKHYVQISEMNCTTLEPTKKLYRPLFLHYSQHAKPTWITHH